jgi:anti-sigma factor RsiW
LALLSQKLGVALTPTSVALPDLTLKRADMLAYDGAPLGQVAYLDGAGPVVFCIISNGEKDAPVSVEKRDDVTLASWGRGGRGYLVAGRLSPQRATALAQTLSARF